MAFHGRLIAALTLAAAVVAGATSLVSVSILVRERVRAARETSLLCAQGLVLQVGRALQGDEDRDLRRTLQGHEVLQNQIDAAVGYSTTILYVAVTGPDGIALLHSNPSGMGAALGPARPLEMLAERSPPAQLVGLFRDDTTLAVDLPIRSAGEVSGLVRVAVSPLLLRKELSGTILVQAFTATVVVLIAFVGSLFVANRVLAPIEQLRAELSRIDTGEGQPRLDLRSGADVPRIAEFFATVGRSLAEQRTGADGENRRMAGIGRMTSAVAHQIRNPLNAMVLTIATMRTRVEGEARRHLDVLDREVRRVDEVIQGFLRLARPERLHLEPVRLEPLLTEVLERCIARAEAVGIRVESSVAEQLPPLVGNPELLKEALTNLILNALDAMGGGGTVRVEATYRGAGGIAVTVRDSGCGIPASVLPRVFDLYFTTKEEGNGIGLPLVKRIAELHGGEVRVESLEGRGTTVTLTLPEAPA